jgi:hypothetical protein
MPQQGQKTTVREEGQEKEAFQVTFTNGALAELEDLAKYFKTKDLTEVIKIAIGVVQKLKEDKPSVEK